jgi:ATP-dependent exoDNAse (exonuclease V) beta subunit
LLFWDRHKGVYLGARDEDGERDDKNPLDKAWREHEKRKNLAESKRVFYVALTRAQERLVLVCPELPEPAPGKEAASFDPEKSYAEDDWRGWVECAGVDLPRPAIPAPLSGALSPLALAARKPAPALAPPRWMRPRHSVTEWNLLARCERAYEWTYARPVAVAGPDDLFEQAQNPSPRRLEEEELSSRELGTRVHGCLERGDLEGLKELERQAGSERFVAAPVIEWARSSPWMKPGDASLGREVWAELAFEVPVTLGRGSPEVLVGSLDRLVRDPERGHTIIDFKVTDKPKDPQELLDAYSTQMELYALGLKRLDPEAGSPSALLVHISPGQVQTVEVPLGRIRAEDLAERASQIVAGAKGRAISSGLCRFCDFRFQCDPKQRES